MAMEVIREETGRLEQLAAEFAALGRPPEGPASAVDLEEMLGRLLASDVPASIRATLRVQPGTSTVEAYYEALLRAFRNLLRNAVDAVAEEGGAIDLSVDSEDGGVRVTIADNGPGVPDGLAERIFEPDFTRKPGGTGLGLAVVRQTVAAHGGQVSARTGERGGAVFIVWLPASPRTASTNGAR
jgi:signal transduction histidine kinase